MLGALHQVAGVATLGPEWLDPQNLAQFGGAAFWVALAIIFAECGLLIGFFLPGDSLLFMVGLFIASGVIPIPLPLACLLLTLAAILGNLCGYGIGYRAGPRLFSRQDSRFFRQEYVEKTHGFFERFGPRAIVLARFVPIVRTFITAMAGVARMDFRTFALYSSIGGLVWATGVTVAGYYLGNIAFIQEHIEMIIIGMVLVSVIPIALELRRARTAQAGPPTSDDIPMGGAS